MKKTTPVLHRLTDPRGADGRRLLMLMRENTRKHHSLYSVSTDDARTWSEPKECDQDHAATMTEIRPFVTLGTAGHPQTKNINTGRRR